MSYLKQTLGDNQFPSDSEIPQITSNTSIQQANQDKTPQPILDKDNYIELKQVDGVRYDRLNNPIHKKNNPKQKITFRDQVYPSTQIADVYLVEMYKQYNVPYEEDSQESCACSIF